MSQEAQPSSLQFDRAEFGTSAPSRIVCSSCKRDVVQSYYTVGDRIVCSACREHHVDESGAVARFALAFGASLGVAIAGAAVWWAVRTFVHIQLSLIAIGIAWGVARAIIWATKGRTTPVYQVLAVAMTYAGVAFNFIPDIMEGVPMSAVDGGVAMRICQIAFTAPIDVGIQSPMMLVIIAIGLWEAWKLTGRGRAVVSGPFSVSTATPATINV